MMDNSPSKLTSAVDLFWLMTGISGVIATSLVAATLEMAAEAANRAVDSAVRKTFEYEERIELKRLKIEKRKTRGQPLYMK